MNILSSRINAKTIAVDIKDIGTYDFIYVPSSMAVYKAVTQVTKLELQQAQFISDVASDDSMSDMQRGVATMASMASLGENYINALTSIAQSNTSNELINLFDSLPIETLQQMIREITKACTMHFCDMISTDYKE